MKNRLTIAAFVFALVSIDAQAQHVNVNVLHRAMIKALTANMLNNSLSQEGKGLAAIAEMEAKAKLPSRQLRKISIDVTPVSFPSGPGVGVRYTPLPPVTVGLSMGTYVLTVGVSAEATWNILWKSNLSPTITAKFTNIRFTGLTDKAVHAALKQFYGDGIDVVLAGQWFNFVEALAGLDYTARGGFHFFIRGGIAKQVGDGGQTGRNQIIFRDWLIPTGEIGLGGAFKWL